MNGIRYFKKNYTLNVLFFTAEFQEDNTGGHAFVCDGIDNEGYYHINWGGVACTMATSI